MANNAPFKFKREERYSLIDSWKRKPDRLIAAKAKEGYIDTVEWIVQNELYDPAFPPEHRTPQESRDDEKNIIDLSRQLRRALANQNATPRNGLEWRLRDIAQSQGICIDYLSLSHLANSLESLEFAISPRLEHNIPNKARKGYWPRYFLMYQLVIAYRSSFGKTPSTSGTGNFRVFLRTLSNIIGIPLGRDLLKRVITDLEM